MATPLPKYTVWEAINVAISLGMRCIEEIRTIANRPPPRDGFGFDDLSVSYDGERTISLKFEKGGDVKEFPFQLPIPIYRGVFSEESVYEKNDVATWGGSIWIAMEETPGHPRDGKWKLAVKAGRDGRKV